MESPRRRFADWMEWQVLPFLEEHRLAVALVGPGAVLLIGLILEFLEEGPTEFVKHVWPLAIPLGWIALLAFAWCFGDWDIRHHRQRIGRLRANQICIHCGYDLRASPDRCPECGKRNDEATDGV